MSNILLRTRTGFFFLPMHSAPTLSISSPIWSVLLRVQCDLGDHHTHPHKTSEDQDQEASALAHTNFFISRHPNQDNNRRPADDYKLRVCGHT